MFVKIGVIKFTTERFVMVSRRALKLARSKFATLRLHGPDQKGILAAYSQLLDKYGCAIMKSEQFTDPVPNHLYQRSIFYPAKLNEVGDLNNAGSGFHSEEKLAIEDEMHQLKERFGLNMSKINWRERPKRVAIFVSKYSHCLVRMN